MGQHFVAISEYMNFKTLLKNLILIKKLFLIRGSDKKRKKKKRRKSKSKSKSPKSSDLDSAKGRKHNVQDEMEEEPLEQV